MTTEKTDLLKKVLQAWEVAPNWQLGQLINYLLNFCDTPELYNVPDSQLADVCDAIVEERDRQAKNAFYTKAILIIAREPTPDTYFEIAKQVLVKKEYELVLDGIVDPDIYQALPLDLKAVVDIYFQWSAPK